jgi:hypothetical protein
LPNPDDKLKHVGHFGRLSDICDRFLFFHSFYRAVVLTPFQS